MNDSDKRSLYYRNAHKCLLIAGQMPDDEPEPIKYYIRDLKRCMYYMEKEDNLEQLRRLDKCRKANIDLLIAEIDRKRQIAERIRKEFNKTNNL